MIGSLEIRDRIPLWLRLPRREVCRHQDMFPSHIAPMLGFMSWSVLAGRTKECHRSHARGLLEEVGCGLQRLSECGREREQGRNRDGVSRTER